MKLKIGDPAPNFKLPDQNGKLHELKSYQGKKILIYFYPKDFTLGCTAQACSLRDHTPEFNNLKTIIFGISNDSQERHQKFAKKYNLPFTLLADEDKKTVNTYGVYQSKKFMGREYMGIVRTSFLIDEKGKILKIYEKVKPTLNAQQAIDDLKGNNKI